MTTILLTGFEAFDHTPVNPAEQVAKNLDGAEIGGATVIARILTNTFFTCIEEVSAAIEEIQPEAVVMMGEYGGSACLIVYLVFTVLLAIPAMTAELSLGRETGKGPIGALASPE